jgi:hypothetical protein
MFQRLRSILGHGQEPVSKQPFSPKPALEHEFQNALDVSGAICSLQGPRVTGRNLKMAIHRDGDLYISECIRRFGIWEPTETEYLLDNLGPGDTFVDIGANIGYFSVIAADLVEKEGRVYAFEPDDKNFALLEANLNLNGAANARAVNAAVSNVSCKATLYGHGHNLGAHGNQKGAKPF